MTRITRITSEPVQKFKIAVTGGQLAEFRLTYNPAIQMWFMDTAIDGKEVNGIRICVSLNILCQYRNKLGYGVLIEVDDGSEVFLINDFSSGRAKFYILETEDLNRLENIIQGGG